MRSVVLDWDWFKGSPLTGSTVQERQINFTLLASSPGKPCNSGVDKSQRVWVVLGETLPY